MGGSHRTQTTILEPSTFPLQYVLLIVPNALPPLKSFMQELQSATPAMQSWWEFKSENMDTVLAFKVRRPPYLSVHC